jgi:hypothetical protein
MLVVVSRHFCKRPSACTVDVRVRASGALRHPNRSGAARSRRCEHHDDLYTHVLTRGGLGVKSPIDPLSRPAAVSRGPGTTCQAVWTGRVVIHCEALALNASTGSTFVTFTQRPHAANGSSAALPNMKLHPTAAALSVSGRD